MTPNPTFPLAASRPPQPAYSLSEILRLVFDGLMPITPDLTALFDRMEGTR